MSLFSLIKQKLGFTDDSQTPTIDMQRSATEPALNSQAPTAAHNATTGPSPMSGTDTPAVDIPAKLDGMASTHPEKLNWRTSIVDLLKLLELDSSLESRKSLAQELHCPSDKMADSAQMNMWLHRAVMRQLAEHGGNVPAELRD